MQSSQVETGRRLQQWTFADSSSAADDAVEDAADKIASITPMGVWMLGKGDARLVQQHGQAPAQVSRGNTYGFYLHTFAKVSACMHLLREVRQNFPNEPVYIVSDGGVIFDAICRQIGNCKFDWRPPANDHWNPYPFLNRFREATRWLGTKFVVLLEPDSEVRGSVVLSTGEARPDTADARAGFSRAMSEYILAAGRNASGNRDHKVDWGPPGLVGGSLFSAESVLDAFRPDTIDWKRLRGLDGDRVWSSETAMSLALALKGYRFLPWSEVREERLGLKDESLWQHYGRDGMEATALLGARMSRADQTLVTLPKPAPGMVTCHGCVWAPDDKCMLSEPIECPTTMDDAGPPWEPVTA